jgi:hypothetical protein
LISGAPILNHGYIVYQGVVTAFDVPQAVPFMAHVNTQPWEITDRNEYVGSVYIRGRDATSGFLATNRPRMR